MQRLLFIFILALFSIGSAERFARFNYVGYFPTSIKRIVIMSSDDCAKVPWSIKDQSKKSVLSGVCGKLLYGKGDHTPLPFNYEIDFTTLTNEGSYEFEMAGIAQQSIVIKKELLKPVLAANMRWFYVMRSGSKECLDHAPGHTGDSACVVYHRKGKEISDPWEPGTKKRKVNMLGGWYDSYVYTKYTQSIAYATYYLLRSYELQPSLFEKKYSKSDLVDVLDNAKFGLDYLLRTMPDDSTFIIQVGGSEDNEHGVHLPAEDPLNGKHKCYSIISPTQMGLTAAALALGSALFTSIKKTEDAKKYEAMAIKVFSKAIASGAAPAWIEEEEVLCKDESKDDNLELAATELFRLTKDQAYLTKAQKFAASAKAAGWIAWSEMHLVAHERLLASSPSVKKYIIEDLDEFLSTSTSNGNIWSLPIEYTVQGLYSYIEAAAGALRYQDVVNDKKYERMAVNLLDYTLGCNNWGLSFVTLANVKNSVRNYYSQIYRLQTRLFPEGGISPGPMDTKTHKEDTWCCYDVTAEPTYPFNTDKVSFFDNTDDGGCMEATICGVADGVFLFTAASKLYGK